MIVSLENQLNDAFKIFKKAKVKLEKTLSNCEIVKDAAMSRMEQAREEIEISGNIRMKILKNTWKEVVFGFLLHSRPMM